MEKKVAIIFMFLILSVISFAGTIKMWHGWSGVSKTGMSEIISKYEEISGNKVEALAVPFDSLQGKFQVTAANGEGPDIITGPADWMGSFVSQGLIEPLDKYINEEDKKEFIPAVREGCIYKDTYYGVPIACNVVALIYNKDLVPEPPLTTNEMIKIGKELTNVDETMYGLIYDYGNYYFHIPWIGGFGGTVLDKNNNPTFTSKAQIESAKFVKSMISGENKIMPDEADYNIMMTLFLEGKVGMIINGSWILNDLVDSGINVGIARLPMVSETGKWPKPIVGPELAMMSKGAKDKEVVYDFMQYLISPDSQATMVTIGNLPIRYDVYDFKKVKEDKLFPYLEGYMKQTEVGVPMPTAPEMGAGVWGNGAMMLSGILNGIETAEKVAKEAQLKAQESINDFRK